MALSGLQNTGKLEKIEAAQNAPLDMGGVIEDPGSNSYTALREKTRSNLEREARRLHLKIEDPTSVFDVDRDQKLPRQIQGAGGDVTGSTTMQSLESRAKSFERRIKRVEDALAPKVPAPIQGKPNQPRLRP
jgi:hypothetical protein